MRGADRDAALVGTGIILGALHTRCSDCLLQMVGRLQLRPPVASPCAVASIDWVFQVLRKHMTLMASATVQNDTRMVTESLLLWRGAVDEVKSP